MGRDILPFIKAIPLLESLKPEFIIKMHTKKSTHRIDGQEWFNGLANNLISIDGYRSCLDLLSNREIGSVAPSGNLVPSTLYIGSNINHIINLLARFNGAMDEFLTSNFVAGSMFICRFELIDFLKTLRLDESDFECEAGQVDGTIAHAIERILSYGLYKHAKLKTVSIDGMVEENFAFADKS